jgi:hypothetical protein
LADEAWLDPRDYRWGMRLSLVLVSVIGMAGCLFDPTVPSDTALACVTDADCPSDDVCIVGRCEPVEALRADAPTVVEVALAPALVGRGGSVEVSFAIEGDVVATPVVEADVGRPVRFEPIASDDGRHHYRYAVDGTEAPGPAAVTATLLDPLGRTTTTTLGTFLVDLQPPLFSDTTVLRAAAGLGIEIGVDAAVDAPATVEGRVVFGDVAIPLAVSLSGLRVSARATVDERFADGEIGSLVLRGRDEAGNDSGDIVAGAVTIDLTAPVLTLQPPPTTVRPRELVRFIATSSENVTTAAIDVAGAGDDTLVPDVGAGIAVGWSWVAPDPGEDTDVVFTAGALVDAAGNAASLPPWTVRIDRTPPQLTVDEAFPAQVRAGDVIATRFSFTESVVVQSVELVRFDEVIVADVVGSGAGPYSIAVSADETGGEGRYDLIVTAVDAAGNVTRTQPGSVFIDALAPTLLDATFNPPEARLGSTVTLQLTFNEAVRVDEGTGALPGLVVNAPLTFVGSSGTTFTYALVVTPETPASVEIEGLTMADLAGNTAVVGPPFSRLLVDNRAPVLVDVAPVASRVQRRAGREVVIEGRILDDAGALDEVVATLAGRVAPCVVGPGDQLRCVIPLRDDDADGVQAVSVNAADVAGNTSSVAVLVTLDGEGPRALTTAFGQPSARPGSAVQLSLLADEALAEAELSLSTGPQTFRPGTSTLGLSLTAPSSGSLTLSAARLVDDLGNERTATFSPPLVVVVDGTGPGIVGSVLSTNPRIVTGDAARAGDTIVVEADVEFPVLEVPSFRFGAAPMTVTFDDGAGHFQATHVVTEADVEGVIVVGATAADELGNITFARLDPPIVVDLTPPTLIPGTARLAIQAPQNAPIAAPAAVGAGGQATFSWVVSERTVGAPGFRLLASGSVVPAALSNAGTSFNARFGSAAFASGRHSLVVEHEDDVGNVGTVDLGVFDVDLDPPTPLSASERASLVHVRAPHGSVDVAAPFHRLEGRRVLAGRAGETISVALDDADLIRLTTGAADGPLSLPLARDFDRVFLQVYDSAGNVANAPGRTPRTELIAGLNGRVIGNNAANPHRLELRRHYTGVGVDPSAEEQNGVQLALRDGTSLVAIAEGRWQDSGPRLPPAAREAVASATHRDTVYLFGGCTAEGPSNEAWLFDGRAWQPLVGEDRRVPPARCGAALASDGERLFLFGGEGERGLLDDFWVWDDRNWKLIEGDRRPTARKGMAFGVTDSGSILIYGGLAVRGVNGEVWRSDNRGESWTQVGNGPPVSGAAFGVVGRSLMVVGGVNAVGTPLDRAVRVDDRGSTDTHPLPKAITGACALPFEGRLLVVGGDPADVTLLVDEVQSTMVPEIPVLPEPMVDGGCGAFARRPLVFGGVTAGDVLLDTTRMLFDDWRAVGLDNLPTARSHAATVPIADDERGGVAVGVDTRDGSTGMLLFGGESGSDLSGEIWEFRDRWTLLSTRLPPLSRAGAACVRDDCLIIGGQDARGLRTSALRWTRRSEEAQEVGMEQIAPRAHPAVAVGLVPEEVVLFGGVTAAGNSLETCILEDFRSDPLVWRCRAFAGPTSSVGAVMTPTPEGPVLWAAGTLWQFAPGRWVELVGAGPTPPVRQFPLLAFGDGLVWLQGGQVGTTLRDDLWSWDGRQWREHAPADPFGTGEPPARVGHAGFFDERLKRLVLFSGDQRPTPVADTWDFLPGTRDRAGVVIDVDTGGAIGFSELNVLPFGAGAFTIDTRIAGVVTGPGGTSIPLVGGERIVRVGVIPTSPGAVLSLDAVDLRLIRP